MSEIDRLIEEGLSLYGEGDLDGALLLWERALVIDPDNAQATSYVDYVRMNYELLTSDQGAEDGGPFGIGGDDPEYQIEILPGDGDAPPGLFVNDHDSGWGIGDEPGLPPVLPDAAALDADEPPPDSDPATFEARAGEDEEVSFEDATREYLGSAIRSAHAPAGQDQADADPEFVAESTPGFGSAEDVQTPQGFGSQTTDIRRRDLGFVQPTDAERRRLPELALPLRAPSPAIPPRPTSPGPAEPDPRRVAMAGGAEAEDLAGPEDLEIDLLQPELGADSAPAYASLELELPPVPDPEVSHDVVVRSATRPAQPGPLEAAAAPTQEVPDVVTLDPRLAVPPDPQRPSASPRDSIDRPIRHGAARALSPRSSSLIAAPTLDLGLRNERRPGTEDETTGQVDVPWVRDSGKLGLAGMDPIDARSAEILEQIDRGAPAIETREERTRRRITTLLERAAAWGRDSDFERAVTAVDLALSEDPNSALAQKLIHRNREAIMNAFHAFLGDLQRAPSLSRPLHELGGAPISPRAAFLLSRVDGTLSLDEILDVSGMPRLEACRYLCQLFLRGILR